MKKVTLIFAVIISGFLLFSCNGNKNKKSTDNSTVSEQKTLTKAEKALISLKKDSIVVPPEIKYDEKRSGGNKYIFNAKGLDSLTVVNIHNWLINQVSNMQKEGWQQWKPVTITFDKKNENGFYYSYGEEFKQMRETIALKIKPKNITRSITFFITYSSPIQKTDNEVELIVTKEKSSL